MDTDFDIYVWFWRNTKTGQIYSSGLQEYVAEDNPHYKAFLEFGHTPIPFDDEAKLKAEIEAAGIQFLKLSLEQELEAAKDAKKAAIDKRTDELNHKQGMSYDGKQFSMSPTAKVNWTGMLSLMTAGMVQFPFQILTAQDEPYLLKDQNAMQSFLLAVMQYDANPASATGKGRMLRCKVETCSTIEEINAIIDDR